MKQAHLIKLSFFSDETDNYEIVMNKFMSFLPFNLEKEKIKLSEKKALVFGDKAITILEIILTKDKHIKAFLKNILEKLVNEEKNLILEQVESRLDKNLDFFLRFDKDEFIKNNKLVLTDSGKCFHIKISIAAFPKKREIGIKIVKEIFGTG